MKFDRRAITFLMAMGFWLIPSSALAGDPAAVTPVIVAAPGKVRQPASVHKFLDGLNVTMFGISAAMMAADIATTNRALQVSGSHEANPLAQSPASLYALKVAGFGAGLGLAYVAHKTGHHKAERIVPLILGITSGVAAAHNAGIYR